MAYGLAGAEREELKDKQLLSLRTELRSNRLNGSGTNKIVRSRSATPYSIKRSKVSLSHTHGASNMIKCKIAAVAVALSALAAKPAFPQAAIQEPGAFEFYHPNDDVLNAGAPTPAAALASTARAQKHMPRSTMRASPRARLGQESAIKSRGLALLRPSPGAAAAPARSPPSIEALWRTNGLILSPPMWQAARGARQ
jgi:hypothetical protein